jgi:hypothetical protein
LAGRIQPLPGDGDYRMKKFLLLVGVGLFLLASPASSIVWDVAYEADPAAGDPVSEGDDRMREMRAENRFRGEVEHFWGPGDGLNDDNGLHRVGSARCYMATAAPTELSDSHSGVAANTIADYDNSTGASFSGQDDLLDWGTNSANNDEDVIGHGRCWIDTDGPDGSAGTADDNKLYIYIGGTGWTAAEAAERPDGDDEILAGAYNLIYNGSFEAVDGDGDSASVVEPEGWTDADADVTIAYVDPTTDVTYGEGYYLEVTDGGAGNGELIQTMNSLSANQIYKVIARAMDDGVSTCTLDVSGATGLACAPDTTTTDVWETLSCTFGTGAAFENGVIELITTGVAGVCLWDHVVVYRIDDVATDRDEISQPGIQNFEATVAAAGAPCNTVYGVAPCDSTSTGLEIFITPPGPGYVIDVYASVLVEANTAGDGCLARLWDGAAMLDQAYFHSGTTAANQSATKLFLRDVIVNPTPGTTLTLGVDVISENAGECDVLAVTSHANAVNSSIKALLIPAR